MAATTTKRKPRTPVPVPERAVALADASDLTRLTVALRVLIEDAPAPDWGKVEAAVKAVLDKAEALRVFAHVQRRKR